MREFLLRRLIQVLPTVLGLLVLIFVISRVIPGDPVRLALGPEATKQQIAAYQEKLGLDRPLPAQFGHYVAGLLRGTSASPSGPTGRAPRHPRLPARDRRAGDHRARARGVSRGALRDPVRGAPEHVARQSEPADRRARRRLPRFWVGILLQVGPAYQLGLFPIVGRARAPHTITGLYLLDAALTGDGAAFLDAARHLALPALTLALPTLAQVARLTRAAMIDVLRRPFMLVHAAYGVPRAASSGATGSGTG